MRLLFLIFMGVCLVMLPIFVTLYFTEVTGEPLESEARNIHGGFY